MSKEYKEAREKGAKAIAQLGSILGYKTSCKMCGEKSLDIARCQYEDFEDMFKLSCRKCKQTVVADDSSEALKIWDYKN